MHIQAVLSRFYAAARIFGVLVFAFAGSSCMIMRTAEKGYEPVRLVQDGTAFEAVMVPEGAGAGLAVSAMVIGGGAVNLFGPYRLQVTAYGHAAQHRTFVIEKLRFRSEKGKVIALTRERIGGMPIFRPGEFRGEVTAVGTTRGTVTWKSEEEGTVTVEADVEIRFDRETKRGTLKFVFVPSDTVKVEAVNVPWEIKRAIWKDTREHPVSAWSVTTGRVP